MCGLVGFVLAQPEGSEDVLGETVTKMARAIRHRGPDDTGAWEDDASGVALGHRRLSILDLSAAGHQPMLSHNGRYVIVFNGEIYNHQALRDELNEAGLSPGWRGHSDTETLLAGIAAWGLVPMLQRSVGMFALAVWDRETRTLQLARDRLGEKPLYYGWINGAFVFGSELKSLRAFPGFNNPVDRDALARYLRYVTVPAPYSIYQDIFKLAPGTVATLRLRDLAERRISIESYWSVADAARSGLANPFTGDEEALNALESALSRAIAQQSIADVPLGAFLSGGVDSSLIVALMQAQATRPIETFTVGFDEADFDEAPHARVVARHLGTSHHELRVTPAEAREVIPGLPQLYDEPFADSSQIPTFLVCQAARTRVTVALSGDAGDEGFGGYNRYLWGPRLWRHIRRIPPNLRPLFGSLLTQMSPAAWNRLGGWFSVLVPINQPGIKAHKLGQRLKAATSEDRFYESLLMEWPSDIALVKGATAAANEGFSMPETRMTLEPAQLLMLRDLLDYLPNDILTKVDRAAMGASLETRVPFLDHRVVELAWRLPLNMKIREGQGKWALRQLLYRHVPRALIERPKAGFAVPVGAWLRGPLRDWAESLLDEQRLQQEGFLYPDPIRRAWREHLSGRCDWTPRLWSVLMFQSWLENQRHDPSAAPVFPQRQDRPDRENGSIDVAIPGSL